jgi:hypothetical protein
MHLTRLLAATALLLAAAACGTAGSGSSVPPDFLNPQAPQAGAPFPYNSPWCP